jgi:hypothetical protein
VRVVVVRVNRSPWRLGRYEAGDDGTKLIEGLCTFQKCLREQGQWMYRINVICSQMRALSLVLFADRAFDARASVTFPSSAPASITLVIRWLAGLCHFRRDLRGCL